MSKPIAETPVLRGRDAKRFLEAMSKPRDKEAVKKERDRVLRNYNAIKNSSPDGGYTAKIVSALEEANDIHAGIKEGRSLDDFLKKDL